MSAFVHRFEPATTAGVPPLLLLHRTGGDEDDLVPLALAADIHRTHHRTRVRDPGGGERL
jgi:predicted esterase